MIFALSYPVLCYILLIIVYALNIISKPDPESLFCKTLRPIEIETFRRFHWFVIYPGGAQVISWCLNTIRFIGLIWALGCLFYGHFWIAGAMALYFGLAGILVVVNTAPTFYWAERAQKGDRTAQEQVMLLESVVDKWQSFKRNR